jgi:hypothetical protein
MDVIARRKAPRDVKGQFGVKRQRAAREDLWPTG